MSNSGESGNPNPPRISTYDYRDRLIAKIAGYETRRIVRSVVARLQKMISGMQSGEDSGLKNVWDEICVQVQGQNSVFMNEYRNQIRSFIEVALTKTSVEVKTAIWLQTEASEDWGDAAVTTEPPKELTFLEDDIVEHVCEEVEAAAMDYHNVRIERFLESGYE